MTERAQRAADELKRRGWQIDGPDGSQLDKGCAHCGYQMRADSRFCQNCATPVPFVVDESSLYDIEAAIAAAIQEKT